MHHRRLGVMVHSGNPSLRRLKGCCECRREEGESWRERKGGREWEEEGERELETWLSSSECVLLF